MSSTTSQEQVTPSVFHDEKGLHAEGFCETCAPYAGILVGKIEGQAKTMRQYERAVEVLRKQLKASGIEPDWQVELFRQGRYCGSGQGVLL